MKPNSLPPLPFARPQNTELWPLSRPLLQLGLGLNWTIRHAVEGTFISGATGSGKSSGSVRTIVQALLKIQAGILFLCAKRSDRIMYEKWVKDAGRGHHLCVVEPNGRFKFNFLDYLSRHHRPGVRDTKNVVQFLQRVLENYLSSQGGGGEDQAFWASAQAQLISNILRILTASGQPFTLDDMLRFLREAPKTAASVTSGEWTDSATFGRRLKDAIYQTRGSVDEPTILLAKTFWLNEYVEQPDRTRASVEMQFLAMADTFNDPVARDLFSTTTTICPEHLLDSAVIIVDVPPREFPGLGVIAQQVFKQAAQECIERRDDPDDDSRRPVAIVMDEAQEFYHPSDTKFQATTRSSRCAVIAATQNLPAIYSRVPGKNNEHLIHGWIGNFNTHIYHANGQLETCRRMAEELGKAKKFKVSGEDDPPGTWLAVLAGRWYPSGNKVDLHEDFHVNPASFRSLRTGGPENDYVVEAYCLLNLPSGRYTGRYYLPVRFHQDRGPQPIIRYVPPIPWYRRFFRIWGRA